MAGRGSSDVISCVEGRRGGAENTESGACCGGGGAPDSLKVYRLISLNPRLVRLKID